MSSRALAGTVPGVGFEIDQTFPGALHGPRPVPDPHDRRVARRPGRVNRVANIVLGVLHLAPSRRRWWARPGSTTSSSTPSRWRSCSPSRGSPGRGECGPRVSQSQFVGDHVVRSGFPPRAASGRSVGGPFQPVEVGSRPASSRRRRQAGVALTGPRAQPVRSRRDHPAPRPRPRGSLWRRSQGSWRLLHHQGTLLSDE